MAFKVISISLSQNTVAIALSLVPLTFINVFVSINHTTLALGHTIDPVTVITVAILIEEGASAVLFVLEPIASVLTSQFFGFHTPVSSLSVAFIETPHTFELISRFEVLDAEALFAVIAPVTYILGATDPFVSFD
jgi:hypothetical protein